MELNKGDIMKLIQVISSVVIAVLVTSEASAGQMMRNHRKVQGVRSGELTVNEVRRIRAGERRIDRAQTRARADGQVTAQERAVILQKKQNQSERIFLLKHNNKEQSIVNK
jgi:hypothetical protein